MSAGKSFIQRGVLGVLILALFASSRALASDFSQMPANSSVDIERMTESLRSSHVFARNGKFKVMQTGPTIVVSTYRHPFGRDIDLKIDALLVAREVYKFGAPNVERVRVYFFNETDQARYVMTEVSLDLIRQFNSHQITNAEVFESLTLHRERLSARLSQLAGQTYEEITSSLKPVDGILHKERVDLVKQIESLQKRGANVNSLRTSYLLIEDAIRQNDDLGARAAYVLATELLENAKLKAAISSSR